MENIERWVQREVRAMTRREVITKAIARQLTWLQAPQVLGITPRHMRHMRRVVEQYGTEAVLEQRKGRTRRRRIKAGTIELLTRLKRDVYGDFSVRHEQVTEKQARRPTSRTLCVANSNSRGSWSLEQAITVLSPAV
jgi:hypothetical protein